MPLEFRPLEATSAEMNGSALASFFSINAWLKSSNLMAQGICVCVFVCLFVFVCVCLCLFVFVCVCLCLFVFVCVCLCLFVFVCVCVFVFVSLCFFVFVSLCLCVFAVELYSLATGNI